MCGTYRNPLYDITLDGTSPIGSDGHGRANYLYNGAAAYRIA